MCHKYTKRIDFKQSILNSVCRNRKKRNVFFVLDSGLNEVTEKK